jgi:hypothetical protein
MRVIPRRYFSGTTAWLLKLHSRIATAGTCFPTGVAGGCSRPGFQSSSLSADQPYSWKQAVRHPVVPLTKNISIGKARKPVSATGSDRPWKQQRTRPCSVTMIGAELGQKWPCSAGKRIWSLPASAKRRHCLRPPFCSGGEPPASPFRSTGSDTCPCLQMGASSSLESVLLKDSTM